MSRPRWNWRRTSVAVGIGALAVGALASVGTAVSPKGKPAATTQYPPHKVMICHHTGSQKNPFVTIIVARKALPAHMRHGDTVGPCPTTAPAAQKAAKQKAAKQKAAKTNASRGKKGSPPGHDVTQVAPAQTEVAKTRTAKSKAPKHTGTAPGRRVGPPDSGSRPERTTPPAIGATPAPTPQVTSPPNSSGSPPGHRAAPPHGGTPPGHGGTPPGQAETPPGQSGTPPGHGGTPPGQGGTAPGQAKK
jgi:hypothetical protein